MTKLIDCDFCMWRGPLMEVGEHLDANPECAALALESCKEADF